MDRIITKGRSFVDVHGRERIFHGVNIVDKRKECDDNKFQFKIDDELLTAFAAKGLNFIRLGTTWSMIEPEPNKYNDAYLDDMMRIFDLCAKHDIYVLFDMHQDLYSSKCYGDGAPDWATITDGVEPKEPKLVWAAGYFWDKGTHKAFDNFWNNAEYQGKGLLDYYAAMWKHVAERFANHPAFFGFDMINEPFPGTDGGKVFTNVVKQGAKTVLFDKRIKIGKLLDGFIHKEKRDRVEFLDQITGDVLKDVAKAAGYKYVKNFDEGKYSNFLNKISTAIREVTDKGILIMENCYWSNSTVPCSTPAIEVNGKREENFCFTPHGYDLMVDTPQYQYASNDRALTIFKKHAETQDRLDCPVLVGEWGGDGSGDKWIPHVECLAEYFEQQKWSFAYWHFNENMINKPLVRVLSRPYPVAVAGKLNSFNYDAESKVFNLEFEHDSECTEPTVVFVASAPKSVEGGEYETVKLDNNGAAHLLFKAVAGKNNIKITL